MKQSKRRKPEVRSTTVAQSKGVRLLAQPLNRGVEYENMVGKPGQLPGNDPDVRIPPLFECGEHLAVVSEIDVHAIVRKILGYPLFFTAGIIDSYLAAMQWNPNFRSRSPRMNAPWNSSCLRGVRRIIVCSGKG